MRERLSFTPHPDGTATVRLFDEQGRPAGTYSCDLRDPAERARCIDFIGAHIPREVGLHALATPGETLEGCA